jgi:hypothetical protein
MALLGHHALLLVGGHGGVEGVLAVDVAAVHRRARVAVDSVRRHHCGRLEHTHVIFNRQNKSNIATPGWRFGIYLRARSHRQDRDVHESLLLI